MMLYSLSLIIVLQLLPGVSARLGSINLHRIESSESDTLVRDRIIFYNEEHLQYYQNILPYDSHSYSEQSKLDEGFYTFQEYIYSIGRRLNEFVSPRSKAAHPHAHAHRPVPPPAPRTGGGGHRVAKITRIYQPPVPISLEVQYPFYLFNSSNNALSKGLFNKGIQYGHKNEGSAYSDYSKSQYREDVWVYENWFYGSEEGTVVEYGSYDGLTFSNTYLLEKFAHWNVIHIEPSKMHYETLIVNRPDTVNIHASLCSHSKVHMYLADDHKQYAALSCASLNDVMTQISLAKVNLLVINVNHSTLSVIQGMTPETDVDAIVMKNIDAGEEQDIKALLKLYECVSVATSLCCKKSSFTSSSTKKGIVGTLSPLPYQHYHYLSSTSKEKYSKSLVVHYPLSDLLRAQPHSSSSGSKLTMVESLKGDGTYKKLAHSQSHEDLWMFENWFYGQSHGVILESGALDGLKYSNTYMLEKYANWTSVHVEAFPPNFENLKVNRPGSINIHAALCSEPRLLHFTNTEIDAVQGFIEFMPEAWAKKWHSEVKSSHDINQLPVVQCMSLDRILSVIGVQHIDVWVLDVEGAELSVLQGVDFSKVSISTIIVECNGHDPDKEKQKEKLLNDNGYHCKLIQQNCHCTHSSFVPSKLVK